MNAGFILLYRQITEWEWYQNPNTFRVFLHILLKANFTDGRFEGREIKRGQLVTSLPKLSVQTKLTIQQVRTALKHLISTGEITDEGTSQYRIITVVKYDEYQKDNRQDNSQSTDEQQTNNRQSTDEQQQYNNNNNGIRGKGNNEKGNDNIRPLKRFIPPTVEEVEAYCDERGSYWIDAQHFIDYYEARGWMLTKSRKMVDWKAAVRTWEKNERDRQRERTADDIPY